MKRFVLAAALLATMGAVLPADAQPYGGPGYGGGGGRFERYDDDDGPRRRLGRERRSFDDDDDDFRPRRGGRDRFGERFDDDDFGPRRRGRSEIVPPAPGFGRSAGFGRVCVTSRGNCLFRPQPFNTPCGCNIPGFGQKRGAIGG